MSHLPVFSKLLFGPRRGGLPLQGSLRLGRSLEIVCLFHTVRAIEEYCRGHFHGYSHELRLRGETCGGSRGIARPGRYLLCGLRSDMPGIVH